MALRSVRLAPIAGARDDGGERGIERYRGSCAGGLGRDRMAWLDYALR